MTKEDIISCVWRGGRNVDQREAERMMSRKPWTYGTSRRRVA
jgi:hypothetical protein